MYRFMYLLQYSTVCTYAKPDDLNKKNPINAVLSDIIRLNRKRIFLYFVLFSQFFGSFFIPNLSMKVFVTNVH